MTPFVADEAIEVEPCRAAQVTRIGHQRVAETFGEKLAKGDGLLLIGRVETVRLEHLFGGLDDEGRGIGVEAVDMSLEPAMLVFRKSKVKASKRLFVPSQM